VDFGTPSGTPLTLKGGATFAGNLGNTGSGGIAISIMTPEGMMKLLHLSQGAVGVAPQLQSAASGVSRPTFGAPGADTQGMVDAQNRLSKAKQEELALAEKLRKLNIEKGLFDLQELARGESRIQALTQQRDLENAKLGLMTTAGALSENELAILLKQKEGDAQINAINIARKELIEQVNVALEKGKLTQEEAKITLEAINTGIEKRLSNTRTQIALDQELLKIQQEQELPD